MTTNTYHGSCHCHAVTFSIQSDVEEFLTCDCSICRKKNALMLKVHESQISILTGAESLSTYQFHTNTAEHYFCSICGIYPFHKKRVTPDHYSVNVFCLSDIEIEGVPVRATIGADMD